MELSLATKKVASLEKKLKERDDQYMAQSQELTELLKKGALVRAYLLHTYIRMYVRVYIRVYVRVYVLFAS